MYKTFSLLLLAVIFTIYACKKDNEKVLGEGSIFSEDQSYSINKAQKNITFAYFDQSDSIFAHTFNFTSTNSTNKASLFILTNKKEIISGKYLLKAVTMNVVNGFVDSKITLEMLPSEEQLTDLNASLIINADQLLLQASVYDGKQFGIDWRGKFVD